MKPRQTFASVCLLMISSLVFSAAVSSAQAEAPSPSLPQKSIQFFLGGSLTFGGDALVTIHMSDDSKRKLNAGGLLELKGGVCYAILPNILVRASIGAHHNEVSAETASRGEGTVGFPRFPVEAMAFFRINDKLNFGAGVRKVIGAVVKGSDAFSYLGSTDMESSVGLILEIEYRLKRWGLFGRYVGEKYRTGSYGSWKDGGHVGLGAVYYFK